MKKIMLIELPLLILAILFNALSSFLDIKPIGIFIFTSIIPLITFNFAAFSEIHANKRKKKLKNLELLNKIYIQIIKDSNGNYAKNQTRLRGGVIFRGHINIDHPLSYFEKELFDAFETRIKDSIYIISGKRKGIQVYISIKYNLDNLHNYICQQIRKIKPSEEEAKFHNILNK